MPKSVLSNPEFLRHKVLKGLAVAIGVFALLLSFLNIYLEAYPLAVIEVLLTLTCWFIYRKIQDGSLTLAQMMILPYFFVLVVIYGTYIKSLNEGLFVWTFIVPTIFYLIFGRKHGFVAALVIGAIQVGNIALKDEVELYSTTIVSINFILAYISVWVVSHVYEVNRESSQNILRNWALTDSLTDANNRLAFKYHFDEKIKSSANLSIVLLDIDYFKKVNDRYGHDAGDAVLKEFTAIVCKSLDADQLFRLGGEEFALLLPETKESACSIAEQIRQNVENSAIPYKDDTLKITFSAGVLQCTPEQDLSVALGEVDKGLYQAKDNGRNQIVCV